MLTDTAEGLFPDREQILLQWFDLSHLLKIKVYMWEVAAPETVPQLHVETLHLAKRFAEHTELLAKSDILVYLQDTSVTHLSAFGTTLHQVWVEVYHLQLSS